MNQENLRPGTRIYYGGDMANDEGFGVITNQTTDKWGTFVDIKMDDGREMNLSIVCFSDEYLGHGGTRWVTKEAYDRFHRAAIERLNERLKR